MHFPSPVSHIPQLYLPQFSATTLNYKFEGQVRYTYLYLKYIQMLRNLQGQKWRIKYSDQEEHSFYILLFVHFLFGIDGLIRYYRRILELIKTKDTVQQLKEIQLSNGNNETSRCTFFGYTSSFLLLLIYFLSYLNCLNLFDTTYHINLLKLLDIKMKKTNAQNSELRQQIITELDSCCLLNIIRLYYYKSYSVFNIHKYQDLHLLSCKY